MKVIFADRAVLYMLVARVFQAIGIRPKVAEVGVLKGENASKIYEILSPQNMFLIDAWSADAFIDYAKNNLHRDWVDDLDVYAGYFGGSVRDQDTFDRLHAEVVKKFNAESAVEIIRATSREGLIALNDRLDGGQLDFIYLDASHQFETVYDDLIYYQKILKSGGIFQLNDCCHSPAGCRQNLGVLEAALKFCKETDFIPLAMTNTDWTDVILARKGAPVVGILDAIINANNLAYVELPTSLFGALKIRYGQRANLSFI